ncbi:hypothetical protein [uncultured Bacteroides sp.]|uniref:hypothetical protein n=1 Tax=uncultured Bacteroides sp. TaxID=162156 RepID=UPI002AABFE6B|nr:hypothetical protein [uncultured Bacteroides sp.]
MKLITQLLFLLNTAFWIGFGAICWYFTGSTLGWVALVGFIIFLVAWKISTEVVNMPLEDFTQLEWYVFIKKFEWSNIASLLGIGLFMFICIVFNFFEMRVFLNLSAS